MPGFNYGGHGDGTGWSSESGGTAPGGGSTGNAGNHNSSGSGGGSSGNRSPLLQSYSIITKTIDDAAAQANGMQPGLYFGYIVDDYGNIVGLFSVGADDANGQDLGLISARGNNGGMKKDAPLQGPGPGFTGDQSDARIAQLKETIRKNYNLVHSGQSGNRIYKAKQDTLKAQQELASINYSRQQKAQEAVDLRDGIKLVADFYSELTRKYGQQATSLSQELAEQARGKTIRNVDEALAAYERYRSYLGAKFSAADRAAIVNALNSVDMARMASQLSKMSKAFGYYGKATDAYGVFQEVKKSFETDNWRPALVKIEALTAGRVATAVTAFAFSAMFGLPLGIIGFALIMALVGSLVNEKLMEKINGRLGI